eukprot:TRINITY_DN2236_c0_g1_i1.p1 TRINITY_DN2236_c0_g1~~TRINITY_DN2236_c0_g1_i1.p1  ORF type:complete len:915 (+),score=148.38 TRINITY_DN2236_c0_g1_i1:50-2794(+)
MGGDTNCRLGGRLLWYIKRRMRLPGDTEEVVTQKTWFFAAYVIGAIAAVWATTNEVPYIAWTCTSACIGFILIAAWMWLQQQLTNTLLTVATVFTSMIIISQDIGGMANFRRSWPLFVVLIDMLLVVRAPHVISICVVTAVCLWLIVSQAELVWRIGILDTPPGMVSADEVRQYTACEHPPCASNEPKDFFSAIIPAVFVFALDFYLTRGFAVQVLREKEAMQAAIAAAEHTSACLADFNLVAADEFLRENEAALPRELLLHLQVLLGNLDSYRPYLPSALFEKDSPIGSFHGGFSEGEPRLSLRATESVPGLTGKEVAVMFTDIKQSTSMWENNHASMKGALAAHNEIVRDALPQFNGYEVKTIGDSFMLAFHTAWEAVQCALHVQTALAEYTWPEGLTRPGMNTDGFDVLSVRIGVHYGDASAEQNTLTGRYDYFGPTVNKAARVEPHCISGALAVTEEVLANCDKLTETAVVIPYEKEVLAKGIAGGLKLWAVVPRVLEQRVGFVKDMIQQAASEAPALPRVDPVKQARHMLSLSEAPEGEKEGGSMQGSNMAFDALSGYLASQRASRTAASVAVVKYAFWPAGEPSWSATEAALGRHLQIISYHLQATHGRLCSVVHNVAVVAWGVLRRCAQHVNESARFFLRLREAVDSGADVPQFHAGLATGCAACGQVVTSSSTRYVTLLGPCVDVATMLCTGAAELGVSVLLTALTSDATARHDANDFMRPHLFPVDMWSLASHLDSPPAKDMVSEDGAAAATGTTVYEFELQSFSQARARLKGDRTRVAEGRRCAVAHEQHRRAFSRRDAAALEALASDPETEPSAARRAAVVARILRNNIHLPHCLAAYRPEHDTPSWTTHQSDITPSMPSLSPNASVASAGTPASLRPITVALAPHDTFSTTMSPVARANDCV